MMSPHLGTKKISVVDYKDRMRFEELPLAPVLVERLHAQGFFQATPVQKLVFQPILDGKSVQVLSKTGSGKTLAYLLPLMQRACEGISQQKICRALILVPTRELADQVREQVKKIAPNDGVAVIVGGENEQPQLESLKNPNWVVATPGRLLDFARRFLLKSLTFDALVFDEADRILDMGFIEDIREVLKHLPRFERMLFFSATLHLGVEEMSYEFGVEPERMQISSEDFLPQGLKHSVIFVGEEEKFKILLRLIEAQGKNSGIIFSKYRDKAHRISDDLKRRGLSVEGLSAQLSQPVRGRILRSFREGRVSWIVASDLAARGLDVQELDCVVNFDLPEDPATYVHRVGRTARAGKQGQAYSLVGYQDAYRLEKLEKFLGFKLDRLTLPEDWFKEVPSSPIKKRRAPRARVQKNFSKKREKLERKNQKNLSRNSGKRQDPVARKTPSEIPPTSLLARFFGWIRRKIF